MCANGAHSFVENFAFRWHNVNANRLVLVEVSSAMDLTVKSKTLVTAFVHIGRRGVLVYQLILFVMSKYFARKILFSVQFN